VFEAMSEEQLDDWISKQLEAWQNADSPPRELNAEVPSAFLAGLRKSNQSQGELQNLWEFYKATRDFRLLAALAESVTGCTTEQVYTVLEATSEELSELNDEATVDALVRQIAKVRQRTANEVDRRALDLLETLVESRAAALKDQPRSHAGRAMAALRRAWKRRWAPGEPRLMAHLLESLGKVSQQGLAAEQISELEGLLRNAPRGSEDRLDIAGCLARTLWAQSRRDEAIDQLEAALKEEQEAADSGLPFGEGGILSQLIEYLEDKGYFARGEATLKKSLAHQANQQQAAWLTDRLDQLYVRAIVEHGEVSLGTGATLYRAVEHKLQNELVDADRHDVLQRLLRVYTTVPETAEDLRRFAFRRLPELLRRPCKQYWSDVTETANALHTIAGPRVALAFLIERIENEPVWAGRAASQGLNQYAWYLKQWPTEVDDLGDLGPRLLRVRLKELRKVLRRRDPSDRFQQQDIAYFAQNRAAFVKVADEVLAENRDSGHAAAYIADWMYNAIAGSKARAIAILLDAHHRDTLDRAGKEMLVKFLMEQGRYADAIPVLEGLVGQPDDLPCRVQLMQAYFKTKQPERLMELLKQTDARFRSGGCWQENVMATLGKCCLDCELFQQAAGYCQEAIAHHQRNRDERGIGDKTLMGYYDSLAKAWVRLGKTAEAIDAAAAALVSLPRDQRERNTLGEVIGEVADLDGYVARLDRQARETGLDSPIIRREIGWTYLGDGNSAMAVQQLRLAAEMQPNDAETHEALLECYDQDDKRAAIGEILRWRDYARRDIQLYADLAVRFQAIGEPEEAERARTSIVEVLPAEAESHQMMAEMFQDEDRWAEAIIQWEQVARIRSLEPTGLLGLAAAQIHEERWQEAKATLKKLRQTAWPARFSEVDAQIRDLEQEIAAPVPK
jgi:tetratricopeptide (TPR) repeat protein